MALPCGHRVTDPAGKRERIEAGECPACDLPLVAPSPPRWVGRCVCCGTCWHLAEDGRVLVCEQD